MIAVLFNEAGVRLGEHSVSDSSDRDRLILFGGGYFLRTETEAKLDGEGWGVAFEMTACYVVQNIEKFNPRRRA